MVARLRDAIQRGTNAARPAATAVDVGTLYYDTTNGTLDRSDGAAWQTVEGGATAILASIVDAKGDLIAATAADTVARLAVGTNGYALVAASGEASGLLWAAQRATVNFVVDGGGSAITTGIKGDIILDFGCVIESVTLLLDQSGSIVIDIWKNTYANYPPVAADSITATAKPTVTTALKSQDTTLTGWNTTINAGDTLRYNVDSVATATRALLALKVRRT